MLRLLITISALTAALASAANAYGRDPAATSPVLLDCTRHGSGLAHAHSLRSLRRALTQLPDDIATYSHCEIEIKSQIAGHVGRVGGRQSASLIRDCTSHGALTRRYTAQTLRRAAKRLAPDVSEYGTCRQAITSQLSLIARR